MSKQFESIALFVIFAYALLVVLLVMTLALSDKIHGLEERINKQDGVIYELTIKNQ